MKFAELILVLLIEIYYLRDRWEIQLDIVEIPPHITGSPYQIIIRLKLRKQSKSTIMSCWTDFCTSCFAMVRT